MNEKMLNTGVMLGRIAAMTAMTDKDDGFSALGAFVKTLNHAIETESPDDAGDLILSAIMSFAHTCDVAASAAEKNEDTEEDEDAEEEVDPRDVLRALFGDIMGDLDELTPLN